MRICIFILLMTAALPLSGAWADGPVTQPAPMELTDIGGVVRRPMVASPGKASVILFIAVECPISNGYAPEINRICKEFEKRGVAFYLVHSDADLTEAAAARHASDFGFTCPILIDRHHELAQRLGATVTPQAFVVNDRGEIAYRGRIDDLYVSLGKKRFSATVHDLRAALDAVLAGKAAPEPRTQAVGCRIAGE